MRVDDRLSRGLFEAFASLFRSRVVICMTGYVPFVLKHTRRLWTGCLQFVLKHTGVMDSVSTACVKTYPCYELHDWVSVVCAQMYPGY